MLKLFILELTIVFIVGSEQNRMITEGLFEGDILGITHENLDELISRSNSMISLSPGAQNDVANGAAMRDPFGIWPKGELYYEISNDFNREEKQLIRNALEEYHQKTCIKIIPRTNQNIHYVTVRKLQGCSSHVGRQLGQQDLSLGEGCVQKGIIIHEFMHALGFFHEQSRMDRDRFVVIKRENILPGFEPNFLKYGLDKMKSLNTNYDYDSIMHYKNDDFSRNTRPTIVPVKSGVEIGQRYGLSQIDVMELKRLYKCDENLTPTQRPPDPVVIEYRPTGRPINLSTDRPINPPRSTVICYIHGIGQASNSIVRANYGNLSGSSNIICQNSGTLQGSSNIVCENSGTVTGMNVNCGSNSGIMSGSVSCSPDNRALCSSCTNGQIFSNC